MAGGSRRPRSAGPGRAITTWSEAVIRAADTTAGPHSDSLDVCLITEAYVPAPAVASGWPEFPRRNPWSSTTGHIRVKKCNLGCLICVSSCNEC
jgi:hypothetical protein